MALETSWTLATLHIVGQDSSIIEAATCWLVLLGLVNMEPQSIKEVCAVWMHGVLHVELQELQERAN